MAEVAEKSEADILTVLRSRYERDGYTFLSHPTRELVPAFLGGYRPDALAISPNGSVVIEIKSRSASTQNLGRISEIIAKQPGWTFRIYVTSDFKTDAFPSPSRQALMAALQEVAKLEEAGFDRPAFLMAWSAMEAFARLLRADESGAQRPMIPSEVIEFLAQSGFIEPSSGKRLRSLVRIRNAIVHGDLSVALDPEDLNEINSVLEALVLYLEDDA